eukprot:CAMPEP_0174378370 /NCGR_PEP_ID=MMETSP0811_2-20130205/122011_1 /TAXON_ID=73025 ORGANISM="Eutreptiella gymnastica-like, Strain CCMP1594" /NCGR_SAMPLE_ID=MMETSP0811_2 /ASSEMBLY_ACC=CAM_ASM_000667 /LENGTH=56 /DNA_ID=CAMNT_0015530575 /DNA_START=2752 /DNA_END=2922 /DNA_ORIENTATION=+
MAMWHGKETCSDMRLCKGSGNNCGGSPFTQFCAGQRKLALQVQVTWTSMQDGEGND